MKEYVFEGARRAPNVLWYVTRANDRTACSFAHFSFRFQRW